VSTERRQFPRVSGPIYCRPTRRRTVRRRAVDIGLGGIRVYADDPIEVGTQMEIDVFRPDGEAITCLAEVVWVQEVPGADPAPYDVGLRYLDVPDEGREMLAALVDDE
jgi:c-di-GMP-binding flagellar brake protein YcgR